MYKINFCKKKKKSIIYLSGQWQNKIPYSTLLNKPEDGMTFVFGLSLTHLGLPLWGKSKISPRFHWCENTSVKIGANICQKLHATQLADLT